MKRIKLLLLLILCIPASAQTQLGADIDGEATGDQSGWSVSLSSDGTTVAIGALFNDGNGNYAGHVRIYEYSSGSWTQLGADIDGEAADDSQDIPYLYLPMVLGLPLELLVMTVMVMLPVT